MIKPLCSGDGDPVVMVGANRVDNTNHRSGLPMGINIVQRTPRWDADEGYEIIHACIFVESEGRTQVHAAAR